MKYQILGTDVKIIERQPVRRIGISNNGEKELRKKGDKHVPRLRLWVLHRSPGLKLKEIKETSAVTLTLTETSGR